MLLTDPWWVRRPEWLEEELAALDTAGIRWERDEASFAQGVARLHLTVQVPGGEELRLVITYPDLYPYFRFEVSAPTELGLHHHQHPNGGNLCLMPRGTERWRPSYTAASILQDRLADVLRTGRSDDVAAVAGVEQEQAEPYSDYYQYPSSMIIVQRGWQIPAAVGGGTLLIGTAAPQGPPPKALLRGAVLEVRDEAGDVVAEAEASLKEAYPGSTLGCAWVQAPEPIAIFDPVEFVKHLLRRYPRAHLAPANRIDGGWVQVWGVLFPEEVGHRRLGSEGWVFACCFEEKRHRLPTQQIERQATGKPAVRSGARPKKRKGRRR